MPEKSKVDAKHIYPPVSSAIKEMVISSQKLVPRVLLKTMSQWLVDINLGLYTVYSLKHLLVKVFCFFFPEIHYHVIKAQ